MLFKGFEHVRMQIEIPQTTAALQIPYFIPYLILPVGFGLMVLRALEDLCAQVYRIRAHGFFVGGPLYGFPVQPGLSF